MAVLVGDGEDPHRYNAEEDFDFIHDKVVAVVKRLFPDDIDIQTLSAKTPNRAAQWHLTLASDIRALKTELEHYKTANGSYPTTEQGLRLLPDVPRDPWGHAYIYRSPGIPHHDPYDVFCAGPDGKPDTADDDWGD